jgi:hypothetical protein
VSAASAPASRTAHYAYRLLDRPAGAAEVRLDGSTLTRTAHLTVYQGGRAVRVTTREEVVLGARRELVSFVAERAGPHTGPRRVRGRVVGRVLELDVAAADGRSETRRVPLPDDDVFASSALDLLPEVRPELRRAGGAVDVAVVVETRGVVVRARARHDGTLLHWDVGGLAYAAELDRDGWPRRVVLPGGHLVAERTHVRPAATAVAALPSLADGGGAGLPDPASLRGLTLRLRAPGLRAADVPATMTQRVIDEGSGVVRVETRPGEVVPGAARLVSAVHATVGDGRDDCTLRAAAAMAAAPSLGLTARRVVGLVYADGAFGYHEWVLVRAPHGGAWWPVDPALEQAAADATHVALTLPGDAPDASLAGAARVLALLPGLAVEVVGHDAAP